MTLTICPHINHTCTSSDSLLWTFDTSINGQFFFLNAHILHKYFSCKNPDITVKGIQQTPAFLLGAKRQPVTVSADRPWTNQSGALANRFNTVIFWTSSSSIIIPWKLAPDDWPPLFRPPRAQISASIFGNESSWRPARFRALATQSSRVCPRPRSLRPAVSTPAWLHPWEVTSAAH